MSMVLILLTHNIWSWIIHQGTQLSLVLTKVQYSRWLGPLCLTAVKCRVGKAIQERNLLKEYLVHSLGSFFDQSSQEWKLIYSGFEEYQHFPVNDINSLLILNINIIQGFPVFVLNSSSDFSLWKYSADYLYVICSRKGLD